MRKGFRGLFFSSVALLTLSSLFSSCRVAKNLAEDQSLLVKNKFVIEAKAKPAAKEKIREDLVKIAAQKPNRKFLGFMPVRMWMYHSATRGKRLTKFKQWLIDKVGEAPVVYDSSLVSRSRQRMETYLFYSGYFHNEVSDTVITENNKTKIVYTIKTNDAWRFGQIELPNKHNVCDSLVRAHWKNTHLKKNAQFDISNVNKERERIENILRNRGFYTFSREYVTFDFDTSGGNNTVNVKITINQPNDSTDHQQYQINNIYIISDYSSEFVTDSTLRDTIVKDEYYYISKNVKFKKSILREAVFFGKDSLYSKDRELKTINRFGLLGAFKFISVDYAKASRQGNYLDCIIRLTPAKKQSIQYSAELNVSNEGLLGVSGSMGYKNKNLSKRADQLQVDVSSGVQLRFSQKQKVEIINITAASNVTYYLNKFLVPFRARIFSRNTNPKTRINLSYNFEHRFDFDTASNVSFLYQLHNFSASFGYEWNENRNKRHLLNPITASFYILPKRGQEFERRLSLNPILKSSYEEQITIGPNYTYTFLNQRSNTDKYYMFFRTSIETAGNVIYGGFRLANLKTSSEHTRFLIAKIPFSQYFRIEGDWRNYVRMNTHSQFAVRSFVGLGVPYGNSRALPFVKQFFVGGPNSLRGFLIREIGPGGYADVAVYDRETGEKRNVGFFNQTGDIKLELNAEFRFDIYKWLKAAIFADAGNVWLVRRDARRFGEFNLNRFWGEFAVDAGAGLRLDFNFFVIRFDYGFPLRDPRRLPGKRWQFTNAHAFKTGQFQLAIGYPF